MSRTIYLIEMTAVIDTAGTTKVYRFGTEAFVSSHADAPPDTVWLPYVRDPGQMEQYLWSAQRTTGAVTIGFGSVQLVNIDGALDELADCEFGGQSLVLRAVRSDQTLAESRLVLVTPMDQVEVTETEVTVRLRDRLVAFDVPLAGLVYSSGSSGGVAPLTRVRQAAAIAETAMAGTLVPITIVTPPTGGNHLLVDVTFKGFSLQDGFPSVQDNQSGIWRTDYFVCGDRLRMIAVRRTVPSATEWVVALRVPVAGGSALGTIIELSGALSPSIWRARDWEPAQSPPPALLRLDSNALPLAGDFAITAAIVSGNSGDAGIVLPYGWLPEYYANNLGSSIGVACSTRQVTTDGAVGVSWNKSGSSGVSFGADLIVLACGTE